MNIILLGKPGAGKGYIAEILKSEYNFKHISTGALCRKNIAENTELGKIVNQYVSAGGLVPSEVILQMLEQEVKALKNDNCVFDGYPRTLDQAESLKQIAKIDAVLFVDVPDNVLIDRVLNRRTCSGCGAPAEVGQVENTCKKCGGALVTRADDNIDVVKNRLKVYEESTAPLKEFYSDMIITLDNSGTVDQTKERLNTIVNDLLKNNGENA